MSWYWLFKIPIYFIIFDKIEAILKVSKNKTDLSDIDKSVLTNFLVMYAILLLITIIM